MKIITIILSTIILNACGGKKEATAIDQNQETATNKDVTMTADNIQDKSLQIEYTAMTRGAYKHVEVTDGKINVMRNRSDKGTNFDCKKTQWSEIVSLANTMNLENLPKLEAPSEGRHADRALAATLKVIKDGKTYQTPEFDHGNPPKEIKELVTYILTLSKVE